MIICICRNLNEAKVHEQAGKASLKDFLKLHQVSKGCKKCIPQINRIFDHAKNKAHLS